jgi:mono/diheme cytochrome c family protein
MRKKLAFFIIVIMSIAAVAVAQGRRSVWTGVYTPAQAERGKAEYERACIRCHAANLEGVGDANLLGDFSPRFSLKGTDFMERWREDTAQSLLNLIAGGMPPRNEPGKTSFETLSDNAATDVIAYIFQGNGFPAGTTELKASELRSIRIQEKDGAKPLPSFSTIQVVGCLTQFTPGVWQLSMSGSPTRVRELKPPTEEEIESAKSEPLGNTEFDLQSIGYVGREFRPIEYEGHKMLVKGILIRQPPNVRIDVRSLVSVSATCD